MSGHIPLRRGRATRSPLGSHPPQPNKDQQAPTSYSIGRVRFANPSGLAVRTERLIHKQQATGKDKTAPNEGIQSGAVGGVSGYGTRSCRRKVLSEDTLLAEKDGDVDCDKNAFKGRKRLIIDSERVGGEFCLQRQLRAVKRCDNSVVRDLNNQHIDFVDNERFTASISEENIGNQCISICDDERIFPLTAEKS